MDLKWYGNCVPISIIFHEILSKRSIPSELKTGFLLLEKENKKCVLWHCWIHVNGFDYDSTKSITQLKPETAIFKRTLSDKINNE